jgi:oxalate decarboxylase/phosphoglucose isomerase-like protein (cupin superfamily)
VHLSPTVYIPADTWNSVTNIGTEPISFAFIFSAPGFEEFMREASVRAGEKIVPLSGTEDQGWARPSA